MLFAERWHNNKTWSRTGHGILVRTTKVSVGVSEGWVLTEA
jgi:hypothetical protein